MLSIVKVEEEGRDLEIVLMLFKEYFDELNENLCFQNFDDELQHPLKKYGPPDGLLLVAYFNNVPSGCIALQKIEGDCVCEMKRLYVKPEYRKNKIGDELVKSVMREAKKRGYRKMVLDTLERLLPAIKLYQKHGFKNTSAYYENPLPYVVYMEKELT